MPTPVLRKFLSHISALRCWAKPMRTTAGSTACYAIGAQIPSIEPSASPYQMVLGNSFLRSAVSIYSPIPVTLFFLRARLLTPIPSLLRARSTISTVLTGVLASPHFRSAICPGSAMASILCSAMGFFVAASGMSHSHPASTFLLGRAWEM